MRSPRLLGALIATFLLVVPAIAQSGAVIRLPTMFSDGAVLQRDSVVTIWGWAEPGEMVTINSTWSDSSQNTTAGADGSFSAVLRTGEAGGPYELIIKCGEQKTVVEDILLGEVWLCSGQSNMEWPLGRSAPGSATLDSSNSTPGDWNRPTLRMFKVPHRVSATPQTEVDAQWVVCTPETSKSFSGVAMHFASVLQQELGVPVGLIGSHWGGTPAESWASEFALDRFAGLKPGLDRLRAARNKSVQGKANLSKAAEAWIAAANAVDPGIAEGWATGSDAEGWVDASIPGLWRDISDANLIDFDGIVWYRIAVEVPASWEGRALTLRLGAIDDMDIAYFGGQRVGATLDTGKWQTQRSYRIPAELVHAGTVTIAVRALDTGGAGGITGSAAQLHLRPADTVKEKISLAGTWSVRRGPALAKLPAAPSAGADLNAHTPAGLNYGMIAPLVPYRIAGAIWYQGESNRTRYEEYRELFPAMIQDWRKSWGYDLPFYFVQIAPFGYGGDTGQAAELREAQRLTLRLPRTGMASTMDIGNPKDIHPLNKHEVGRRLALWAMVGNYGAENLVPSGPAPAKLTRTIAGLSLSFDYAGAGLTASQELKLFEVAAPDDVWKPAQATISADGISILVQSAEVPGAVQVRYAWGAADAAELFNAEGLPASSFRVHL